MHIGAKIWAQNSPSIPIVIMIGKVARLWMPLVIGGHSRRKFLLLLGPKLGALWMYVCTLTGLQRDIVNHKENFFLCPRTYFLTLCRSKVWIGMKVLQPNSIILGTRKLWWIFPIKQKFDTTAAFLDNPNFSIWSIFGMLSVKNR